MSTQELVVDQLKKQYPDHDFTMTELVSLGALEYLTVGVGAALQQDSCQ